jgi:hypothetical protein
LSHDLPAPSERSVATLLATHSLVHSLVIFASHRPPTLPPSPAPTVRVLRLASSLAVEDAGAARLVSTLEWAERVARVWRASSSGISDVVCYDEATKDLPGPGFASRSFVNIPLAPVESISRRPSESRKGLPFIGRRRRSSSVSGVLSTGSLPPIDPSQRPFDAVLNYISRDVVEKHVLKQTILVTSITRPFLAPTLSPYHKLSGVKRSLSRSSSRRGYSLPPTPPYQSGDVPAQATSSMLSVSAMPPPHSHMIHIVPPTAFIGLIRSLDLFLSSFSRQAIGPGEVDHAKQYILNSSTMRETVVPPNFGRGGCSVLDLILLGGLDSISGKSWIGSSQDIRFLPTSPSTSAPPNPPVPPKPARSSSKTTSDSYQPVNPVSPSRTRMRSSPQSSPPPGGDSPTRLRRIDKRIAEHSQPVSEQVRCAISDPPSHSDPIRYPHLQGPYKLGTSPGRAKRRSKFLLITKQNDPVNSPLGLPTPPDSDEDARRSSPLPNSITSTVSTPQKKSRWQFWKS